MTTATSITVRVPLAIRRRPGRRIVVTPTVPGAAALTTRADPALVKALARAFRYQRLLDEGHYASISEMAAAEKIERGYLGTLLRLTLLAPEMVEAILDGHAVPDCSLPRLLEHVPVVWTEQTAAVAAPNKPKEDQP
ncbi:MAG TPA: hypothetical protein VGN83_16000 [Falsiroseomonas sp.]|jgi:hypothetical protein|nr:hypothetical protein [Falsiroseomonas sp.]